MKNIFSKFFMIITFLLIYNLIFNIENCKSQWVQMSNGMGTTQYIRTLASCGNNIFAGMDDYGVYFSTNFGANWTQSSLNNKSINTLAVKGNNIFAGAYEGGVYLSTNNGSNWTLKGLDSMWINSLSISGNNIIAGTVSYGVFLSTNCMSSKPIGQL